MSKRFPGPLDAVSAKRKCVPLSIKDKVELLKLLHQSVSLKSLCDENGIFGMMLQIMEKKTLSRKPQVPSILDERSHTCITFYSMLTSLCILVVRCYFAQKEKIYKYEMRE
jgi:hypothetical protein